MSAKTLLFYRDSVVRSGIEHFLEQAPGIDYMGGITSQADYSPDLLVDADLLVLDLHLPGGVANGNYGFSFQALSSCAQSFPDLPILAVSNNCAFETAYFSAFCGASGFVSAMSSKDVWAASVQRLAHGATYLPSQLYRIQFHDAPIPDLLNLSVRQFEVFQHCGFFYSTSHIADSLFLSPKTVGSHYDKIIAKLGLGGLKDLQRSSLEWQIASEIPISVNSYS